MEREVYIDYSRNQTGNKPRNSGTTPRSSRPEARAVSDPTATQPQERETDGWVVLGVDRSYFRQRLITFDYTPPVTPQQLVEVANLQSREQLDELISEGLQGLWDDLPIETRQKYKDAETIRFKDIDPILIIQRGRRKLGERRKPGSMRAKAVENAFSVRIGDDYNGWKVRDDKEHPYQASFAEVLRGVSLSKLAQESQQRTGKAFALDFMGYGQVLRILPIRGGVAVALGDPRNDGTKQQDQERNISFIEGNVLKRSTWREMKAWLDSQDVDDKYFDLILSRPVRGLDDLTDNKGVNIVLLQRAWQMLSPHGGILLTQFLEQVFEPSLVDRWVRLLNQTPGIQADYSLQRNPACEPIAFRPVLSLIRSEGAPNRLPLL